MMYFQSFAFFHGLLPQLLAILFSSGRAAAAEIWVSINDSGAPKTITPVMSTVSGTPTIISGAAPFEVTATVRTIIDHGYVSTSSGRSLPTAHAGSEHGAGAFPRCDNAAGPGAPFCDPPQGSLLHPGTTYYITWDAAFFNSSNTSVIVRGTYRNATTGAMADEAFASDPISVSRAFYPWQVDQETMQKAAGTNISIGLYTLAIGNSTTVTVGGPDVLVKKREPFHQFRPSPPSGMALYIGLPIVLGFVTVMVVGTCLWNRKARSIGLGNIMSRARREGYEKLGSGKSKRGRRNHVEESIRLMDYDTEADYADRGRFSIDSNSSAGGSPTRMRRIA